jgi:hypothetical protein
LRAGRWPARRRPGAGNLAAVHPRVRRWIIPAALILLVVIVVIGSLL